MRESIHRPSRRAATLAAWTGLVALLSGCALGPGAGFPSDPTAHAALDVPPAFEHPATSASAGACLNPMRDPRDGAELRLVRSAAGRGDYEVPAGRYGVRPDELLRLDCSSGRPIGVVRR